MSIYAIRRDGSKYQELDLEFFDIVDYFPDDVSLSAARDFSLNNFSMKDFWPNIRTGFSKIDGEENLIPDVTTWLNATLVLSPKAFRYLGETLSSYGEFLPVHIDDEIYQIFNCLTVANVIESESSSTKLVFDEASVDGKLLFKSPFQYCIDVFCTERVKNIFEDLGLQGVIFDTRLATPFED